MQTHQWHHGFFLKDFSIFIQQNFQLKRLFHNSGGSSNCHVCIHRTSRATTKMDNITNRIRHSPLLICCPTSFHGNRSVFCTGLCKWVHKSNLYSLRVLHRNLHPCEMVTGCSSTVSSRVPQFHMWSLRSTQRAQDTGVSTRTKSEPTLTDVVCFKSLLHIWTWTLSGCLCSNSLRTELILEGGTYTGCRQPWSTTWNTQG